MIRLYALSLDVWMRQPVSTATTRSGRQRCKQNLPRKLTSHFRLNFPPQQSQQESSDGRLKFAIVDANYLP